MTISQAAGGPTTTLDMLHEGHWAPELDRLAGGRAYAGATGRASASLRLGEAYRVEHLAADALADGTLDAAVRSTGWRHLLYRGARPVAEIELDGAQNPVALHEGPAKDGLRKALARAERLEGDYQASVVQAPALKFVALRLHGGDRDLLIPYEPNLTPLANYRAVPVEQALAVLRPIAAEVIRATAAPGKNGDPVGG